MKYYFALIVLLAIPVLAQDVTISLAKGEVEEVALNVQLGPEGVPSFAYNLPTDKVLNQVRVYAQACARGCGQAKLCVKFDDSPKDCKTVSTTASWIGPFTTAPHAVHKIELSYEGISGGGFAALFDHLVITVSKLEITGGTPFTSVRNLLSFRGDSPIPLGSVNGLIDTDGFTGNALVVSSDSRGVVWFDEVGTVDISATSRRITGNFDDEVLICANMDNDVDIDGNPLCDYKEEELCGATGQDRYDNKCCGSAAYPACAYYDDVKAYCGRESALQTRWAALGEIGLIVNLADCPNVQVVSNGTNFFTCLPPPAGLPNAQKITGRLVIYGHEYACDAINNIVECGANAPFSGFNGKLSGESVAIDGKRNYCAVDGKWMISLNEYDSCVAAGFAWTGTKCCGEVDDPVKTYEDPFVPGTQGSAGGCFNGIFIPSGGFIGNDPRLMNARGRFVICDSTLASGSSTQPAVAPAPFTNSGILPLVYGPCGNPLSDIKLTGTANNALCSPHSEWKFTSSTDMTAVKSTIWQIAKEKGCCPENQCWDGVKCRDIGEYHIVGERGFRCQ